MIGSHNGWPVNLGAIVGDRYGGEVSVSSLASGDIKFDHKDGLWIILRADHPALLSRDALIAVLDQAFGLQEAKPADNVVDLPVITRLPIPPQKVLAKASQVEFERVLIIGITQEGREYFAMSDPDGGTTLWDMERAKHRLMQVVDEME